MGDISKSANFREGYVWPSKEAGVMVGLDAVAFEG